ncbi:putative transmembrane protein [Tieghemostelium lacteum]|uniref:Putative transmembrane protein n=1 Tax=Tieghemostelium lacteum TaxID=361077 RepID=A0A151Z8A2_TIELA|nr:putative transmembrane protein [Tieghemostelium lacteum]|eukprot:KYQ90199.1 putative transmembrane protein [Tieghemostelium lacteum]
MENNNNIKVRAIITGATGMVGEGVAHECILSDQVESVLLVNRRPSGIVNPKVKEIVHQDFMNLEQIEKDFAGYNACFYCAGVTSAGKSKEEYEQLTYDLTMNFANTVAKMNPDKTVTFNYVTGMGTDETEKSWFHWARVKGKTENDISKIPQFKSTYMYRPGFIRATPGLRYTNKYYKYIGWLFPVGKLMSQNGFTTLEALGKSMINTVTKGYEKRIIYGKDMFILSQR